MLIEVEPCTSPEATVIVISDDEEDSKKDTTPHSEDPKGSLYDTAPNSPAIEEAQMNPMSLLLDSIENVVSLFQWWRSNDDDDAETSVNNNTPPVQPPITSRCIKPSKEKSVHRFTPYQKIQATLKHDNVLGQVSEEEKVLIMRDGPAYDNGVTKFKPKGEIFGQVSRHLNYNTPTLKEMSLVLENLYNTSLSQGLLTTEQETFVFCLINRILHFLEALMLVSGEGSIMPFKPPSDFRSTRAPKTLPDCYYGDVNQLNLNGSDISRYALFKMIRHFDQITVSSVKEKAEKYLLETGTQPRVPMKRTYEEAMVEARKREAERQKYKATSCKLEAEKEFGEARKRQAIVDKKEIIKPAAAAVVNKTTKKEERNRPAVVKNKDESHRSTRYTSSSSSSSSSNFRSISPPIRNNRRPWIRPDEYPVSTSCLANAVILRDIPSERSSGSSRWSMDANLQNENRTERSRSVFVLPTDSRMSRRPLFRSEEEREGYGSRSYSMYYRER
ncbi:hypothetical protein BD770DRAFT_428805 [Pilaira anomala]|nr:hypothetical protein BD770DRAFT_428805 [Pilaira anomala]